MPERCHSERRRRIFIYLRFRIVFSNLSPIHPQRGGEGKGIQLPRFAKIFPVYKDARKGRNPKTGEEIEIAAQVTARMLPLSGLKNALNGKE